VSGQPELVQQGPLGDLWKLGDAACLMPRFNPDWSPMLKSLYQRRLVANFTGRCSCGASVELAAPIAKAHATGHANVLLVHENDCLISDDVFRARIEAES